MIKQCKGKALDKVAKSRLLAGLWFYSTKVDGNYVQIHKVGDKVRFFTSGGKEFYLSHVADRIVRTNQGKNFKVEVEYNHGSLGKLGDRVNSAKLTTYRTEFEKGIESVGSHLDIFQVFDVISYSDDQANSLDYEVGELCFELREMYLRTAINYLAGFIQVHHLKGSLEDAKTQSKALVAQGWEGVFAKHATHLYEPGKRVNTAIKLKERPDADLVCIDVVPGEGKYEGLIGSLVLRDADGLEVSVGSGLSDSDRNQSPDHFIGETIEIQYEQKLATYIQPVVIGIK